MTKRSQVNSTVSNREKGPRRKMSLNPRKSEMQREEIFKAIAKLMLKRRWGKMSLDDIASQAGGSKGIIYYYFKSKGDMIYQMNMHAVRLVREAVTPFLQNHDMPPRERLEGVARAHLMVVCNYSEVGHAIWYDMRFEQVPVELKRALTRVNRRLRKEVTKLVQEVIETERLVGVDAEVATRLVIGIINSISMWYRKDGRLSSQEVIDYGVRCIFNGVLNTALNLPEPKS